MSSIYANTHNLTVRKIRVAEDPRIAPRLTVEFSNGSILFLDLETVDAITAQASDLRAAQMRFDYDKHHTHA